MGQYPIADCAWDRDPSVVVVVVLVLVLVVLVLVLVLVFLFLCSFSCVLVLVFSFLFLSLSSFLLLLSPVEVYAFSCWSFRRLGKQFVAVLPFRCNALLGQGLPLALLPLPAPRQYIAQAAPDVFEGWPPPYSQLRCVRDLLEWQLLLNLICWLKIHGMAAGLSMLQCWWLTNWWSSWTWKVRELLNRTDCKSLFAWLSIM